MDQLEAWAAFLAAENADQPVADRSLSQQLVDELVFAVNTLEVVVLGTDLLDQTFGEIDQGLGLFLSEGHEVLASDLENVIDEPLKSRSVGDGQIALEDHAVKAREHGDDQVGKLGDEVATASSRRSPPGWGHFQPHSGGRTLFLPILLGCGFAALGKVSREPS